MAAMCMSRSAVAVLAALLLATASASASQDTLHVGGGDWWTALQATGSPFTPRRLSTCSGTGAEQLAAFSAALSTQWCAPYQLLVSDVAALVGKTRAELQASADAFCGTGRLPVRSRCYVELKAALGAEVSGECAELTAQRKLFALMCVRASTSAFAGAGDGTGAACVADTRVLTLALASSTPGTFPALTSDVLSQVCNSCTANVLASFEALNPVSAASISRMCVRDPATNDFCWPSVAADMAFLSNPANAATSLAYAAEKFCTPCGKVTFDLMTSGYKTLLAADPTNAVAANGLAVFRVLSRFGCGMHGTSTCASLYTALFAQTPEQQASLFTTMQAQCPADNTCPAGCVGVLQGVQAQYGCCFRGLLEFLELQGLLAVAAPGLTADLALANINNDCAAGGISLAAMCRVDGTATESYRMIFHNVASAAVIGDATNEMNVKTGAKNMLVEGTGYASTVFTVTDVRAHGDNAIAITVEIQGVSSEDSAAAKQLVQQLTVDNAWNETPFTTATGSSVQANAAASVWVAEDGPVNGAATTRASVLAVLAMLAAALLM